MRSFPLFLKLQERPVLLAGSGDAAAAKLRLLVAAGARVRVFSETPSAELRAAVRELHVAWNAAAVSADDLKHVELVIGAHGDSNGGDENADRALSNLARAAGKLVNIVDRPELSDFTMPAIVDRGEIVVAISTHGASPVLAQRVRAAIESVLPPALGRLARFAQRFRSAIQARIADNPSRRRFWDQVFSGPIGQAVLAGDERRAARDLIRAVNRGEPQAETGHVSLVGAGPGDPELLTLRAARALREADVIVYDKLVDSSVLDYARRDARRIYVGKSKGDHTLPQPEINALLIAEAKAGRHVVRLKGGDPFVFGRGGEELDALVAANVRVDVVPGITAATGCAAYAGFPLTHRDHAASVTFVSGQAKDGIADLDWRALVNGRQTIVVYMGLSVAGEIAGKLIGAGLSAATPIAIIENGTRWDQRVIKGELNQAAALVRDHGIAAPALLVIGEVTRAAEAGLRAELKAVAE